MLLALLKPRELARLETTTKNYKLLARLYLMVEKIIVAENMDKHSKTQKNQNGTKTANFWGVNCMNDIVSAILSLIVFSSCLLPSSLLLSVFLQSSIHFLNVGAGTRGFDNACNCRSASGEHKRC